MEKRHLHLFDCVARLKLWPTHWLWSFSAAVQRFSKSFCFLFFVFTSCEIRITARWTVREFARYRSCFLLLRVGLLSSPPPPPPLLKYLLCYRGKGGTRQWEFTWAKQFAPTAMQSRRWKSWFHILSSTWMHTFKCTSLHGHSCLLSHFQGLHTSPPLLSPAKLLGQLDIRWVIFFDVGDFSQEQGERKEEGKKQQRKKEREKSKVRRVCESALLDLSLEYARHSPPPLLFSFASLFIALLFFLSFLFPLSGDMNL